MFYKKNTYKPLYKKFILLRKNVQNREKVYKFTKQKWTNLILYLNRFKYKNKLNIQLFDQNLYFVSRFDNFFKNKYKYNLHTKQRISLFYGKLSKKYLKRFFFLYKKKQKIYSKNNVYYYLENRLDVVLYRAHFVLSIRNARQLICHGQILVNNKIVKTCSFLLEKGDKIEVKYLFQNLVKYNVLISKLWPLSPKNLQICYKTFQIIIIDDRCEKKNISIDFPFLLDYNTLIRMLKI